MKRHQSKKERSKLRSAVRKEFIAKSIESGDTPAQARHGYRQACHEK